jgi:hypothetical protein
VALIELPETIPGVDSAARTTASQALAKSEQALAAFAELIRGVSPDQVPGVIADESYALYLDGTFETYLFDSGLDVYPEEGDPSGVTPNVYLDPEWEPEDNTILRVVRTQNAVSYYNGGTINIADDRFEPSYVALTEPGAYATYVFSDGKFRLIESDVYASTLANNISGTLASLASVVDGLPQWQKRDGGGAQAGTGGDLGLPGYVIYAGNQTPSGPPYFSGADPIYTGRLLEDEAQDIGLVSFDSFLPGDLYSFSDARFAIKVKALISYGDAPKQYYLEWILTGSLHDGTILFDTGSTTPTVERNGGSPDTLDYSLNADQKLIQLSITTAEGQSGSYMIRLERMNFGT